MHPKAWSSSVFLPFLAPAYKGLCAASAIQALQAATDSFDIEQTSVTHPDTSTETQARPLLIWRHARKQGAVIYKPLRPNTIAKYFDSACLANVHHRDKPRSDTVKAHSVRNAVASALAAMGVPRRPASRR